MTAKSTSTRGASLELLVRGSVLVRVAAADAQPAYRIPSAPNDAKAARPACSQEGHRIVAVLKFARHEG
jgi:hypothetical protein